jgi:hypothetical protein
MFDQDPQYLFDDEEFSYAKIKALYLFKYPFNEKSAYYPPKEFQYRKNLQVTKKAYSFT